MTRKEWSSAENRSTVADYLEMLRKELAREPYNKSSHRLELMSKLDGRSDTAIERKHQNISAILLEERLDAIDGYKPLGNYQNSLRDEVIAALRADSALLELLHTADLSPPPPDALSNFDIENVMVPRPPDRNSRLNHSPVADWRLRARTYDFDLRDQQARTVGRAGEEFVFRFERLRLAQEGRADLAKKVEWVSDSLGDGAGFDVLSWDHKERELFIEVKATNLSRYQPFLITRNEVAFASSNADQFSLYRVFHLSRKPKIFRLDGPVEKSVHLEPVAFEGRL